MGGRLCLILATVAALQGCAYLESADTQDITVSAGSIAEANTKPRRIRRIAQTQGAMLDSLPVGTVVAFYPADTLRLPEGWVYADGSPVTDRASPFFGRNAPQLNDDRYLIGTLSAFGRTLGRNDLPAEENHDHGGHLALDRNALTGPPDTNAAIVRVAPGEMGIRVPEQGHKHAWGETYIPVEGDGEHDHGGDNRPRSFGILYIIKIK